MSARTLLLWLVAAAAAGAAARPGAQRPTSYFPHQRHARLFPLCTGCHAGIATGDSARFYPAPSVCTACHNGRIEPRVQWRGPHQLPSNVVFSHPRHDRATPMTGRPAYCLRCHAAATAAIRPGRMAVTRARPELCITCHEHAAPSHLAGSARCPACHVPIALAAGLPTDTIAEFPRPATHAAPDFVLTHGAGTTVTVARTRCAICHARQSCVRCHPNAAQLPAVAALRGDLRVAMLVAGKPPRWPVPLGHLAASWLSVHGAAAAVRPLTCGNCHTQAGCRGCHIGEQPGGGNAVIARLPLPTPGGVVGALAVRTRTGVVAAPLPVITRTGRPLAEVPIADAAAPPLRIRVHPAGFATNHGAAAGTRDPNCRSCHQNAFCVQCHDGPTRPVFHPPAYLSRHAADVYAAVTDCASCHSAEAFCRACHRGAGLESVNRIDVAFHTGQPLWLLQHGQAARQGLESCASCHTERSCLRCHSTLGQNVNPHGPDFDAARLARKAPLMCALCHVGPPPT